jgi:hypothetical protein
MQKGILKIIYVESPSMFSKLFVLAKQMFLVRHLRKFVGRLYGDAN